MLSLSPPLWSSVYKSPGLDGIINEFYQIYWDTIKEDLFEVLLEIFDKFEICDSQCRGMLIEKIIFLISLIV
jgi:hypothetical protein